MLRIAGVKWLMFLGCLVALNALHAQQPTQAAYSSSAYANTSNPEVLAHQLTDNYKTEMEKVQSIFHWITDNISYKVKPTYWSPAAIKAMYDDDTSTVLKPINVRVAENVLRSNMAVCDGYAKLFAALCNFANIKCEVVTGYARFTTNPRTSRFKSNHSWNAVCIDSTWHLLDVTWASGYITFGNEFVRHYNGSYFLTPPQQFIQDHYPEELKWTLLTNPPMLKEFDYTPFKSQRFSKVGVVSYKPERGVIEAAVGDTLRFDMAVERIRINTDGSPDTTFETLIEDHPDSWVYIKPDRLVTSNKIRYSYVVPSADVEWVNLVLYDDVVMRYRIKVKGKEDVATAQ